MRITKFSDYSLRILIYLASKPGDELSTISEISKSFSISVHHVRSVVHKLGQLGYINSIQGKGGGFELASDTNKILIGEVIKQTEKDFYLVECYNPDGQCPIVNVCKLQHILSDALEVFFESLNQYTLEDLTSNKRNIMKALDAQL